MTFITKPLFATHVKYYDDEQKSHILRFQVFDHESQDVWTREDILHIAIAVNYSQSGFATRKPANMWRILL